MKKINILFLMIFAIVKVQAQVYLISFAGTGASTKVDSVKVENVTQCKSLSLNGSDVLDLNGTVGVKEINNITDNTLHVYPNPVTDNCLIAFQATEPGEATLELYDIAGKRIIQMQEYLIKGLETFSLSGLGSGIYVLKVKSTLYSYSAKIVSCKLDYGLRSAEIKQIGTSQNNALKTEAMKSLKGNKAYVVMEYNPGDTLMLKGFSGIYTTIFMLVPDSNQTVSFNFISCTDGDTNNYPVVQIGKQIWMAENLKTTSLNDGTALTNIIYNNEWSSFAIPGYCWYNNDTLPNKNIYGGLYNYVAVLSGKLCPKGWHVPSDSAWTELGNYLNGDGGKMKENCTSLWPSVNIGATNSSGFSALPGGIRFYTGAYEYLGDNGDWWSSTSYAGADLWYRELSYSKSTLLREVYAGGMYGFSVRCLKNN